MAAKYNKKPQSAKPQKTYGDYLREKVLLDPTYKPFLKNYRKKEDAVIQPQGWSKTDENDYGFSFRTILLK